MIITYKLDSFSVSSFHGYTSLPRQFFVVFLFYFTVIILYRDNASFFHCLISDSSFRRDNVSFFHCLIWLFIFSAWHCFIFSLSSTFHLFVELPLLTLHTHTQQNEIYYAKYHVPLTLRWQSTLRNLYLLSCKSLTLTICSRHYMGLISATCYVAYINISSIYELN